MPFFSKQALLPLLPQDDPNPAKRAKDLAISQRAYLYIALISLVAHILSSVQAISKMFPNLPECNNHNE